MKKKIIFAFSTLILLASCATKTSNASSSINEDNSNSQISNSGNSTTNTNQNSSYEESTSNFVTSYDDISKMKLSLKMFGELHLNGQRTIYALTENVPDEEEIVWESSNSDVINISARDGYSREGQMLVVGVGKCVIKAYLRNVPTIYATYEFNIEEGNVMPTSLYNKLRSSMTVSSIDRKLSYDKTFKETVDSIDEIETIYEETDSLEFEKDDVLNLTDCYQITVKNQKTGNVTYKKTYVEGRDKYVSTEYLTNKNEIAYERIKNSSDEEIRFDSSYYVNMFNRTVDFNNTYFQTYDNGKTYYYVGGYTAPINLCTSLFLEQISPDDFYISILDNDELELHFVVDPYNSDSSESRLYGREMVSKISNIGTAKVDHIPLLEHKDYQDDLSEGLKKLRASRNYKVSYVLDYEGGSKRTFNYTFLEDAIDEEIIVNNTVTSHKGSKKESESTYYNYAVNDDGSISMTERHLQAWNAVNRYPTFDFCAEIFDRNEDKSYVGTTNDSTYLTTCFYLPKGFEMYNYDKNTTITLDENNNFKTMSTVIDALGDKLTFTATFSNFETAKIDLDFSKLVPLPVAGSWEEESISLANAFSSWNLNKDDIPYLHPENGFSSSGLLYSSDSSKANGIKYVFIESENFTDTSKIEKYVEDYQYLLEEFGYTDTNKTLNQLFSDEVRTFKVYKKGNLQVAIGRQINVFNGYEQDRICLYFISDDLTIGN